jgi:CheY-like chemotaxis protein
MSNDRNILIVEDDSDVRGAMAALLEGEGYQVIEAEDGAAALRHLRSSEDVCLILLDLFMPVMNGWKFRDEQRRDPRIADIPVVVVSADAAAPQKAAALGAVDAMVKPSNFDRLLKLVAEYC